MARLTRDEILEGWARLGRLAAAEGREVELLVVGGAVMAVHFQCRESTADVDAIFQPASEVRGWSETVAEELGWPADWLNDGAKGYITRSSVGPLLFQGPGILVRSVAIEHLLALKLMAWRDQVDFDDAERLFRELEGNPSVDVTTLAATLALVDQYFVPQYRDKAQYALEELWELTHEH